jgi:hypothetical protein
MSQFDAFGHDAMEAERLKKGFKRYSLPLVALGTSIRQSESPR